MGCGILPVGADPSEEPTAAKETRGIPGILEVISKKVSKLKYLSHSLVLLDWGNKFSTWFLYSNFYFYSFRSA